MPRTLEEILKSKGFADEDLAGMSTLLSDNRFRGAFEGLESERETLQQRDREWDQLRTTKYEPALRSAEEEARKVRLELAQEREKVRIARDYGYLDEDGDRRAAEAAAKAKADLEAGSRGGGFDPADPKFRDFAGNFARGQGDAMAKYTFVMEEYRDLNGQSINSYRGSNGQSGIPGLLADSIAANKPIDQYAEEKFGWAQKRQVREQQRQKDYEDGIRKNEREKIILEQGLSANPNMARHVPSRQPFIPQVAGGKGQPWEKSSNSLAAERRQRATETQLKSMVQ